MNIDVINRIKRMDSKAKAGILYLFGNMFNKAISFLVLPIFTRLLTTEEYGLVSAYLSVEAILSTFIALNLGNTVRNAFVDYKDQLDDYMSTMFVTGYATSAIITGILFLANHFMGIIQPEYLVFMCCIQACMSGFLGAFAMRYMMSGEYIKRTLILMLPNLLVTILSVIVLLTVQGNRYIERVMVYFSVYAVAGLILTVRHIAQSKRKYKTEYLRYALPLSVPIIFHTISTVILSQSDRTMITVLYNASENGIYSVVYNYGMVALILTTSAENVWIPWFTQKELSNEKQSINNIARIYIFIISCLIVGLMLVSPDILVFMAGEKYRAGVSMIPPIVVASFFIFLTSFSINLEYYHKKTVFIARNTIISGLVNIGLNLVFIPKYGGIAAAYTTAASYLVNFVLHYFNSKKMDSQLFPIEIYLIPIGIIMVGTVLYYQTIGNPIIRWILGGVVVLCVLLKYRSKLLSFMRSK